MWHVVEWGVVGWLWQLKMVQSPTEKPHPCIHHCHPSVVDQPIALSCFSFKESGYAILVGSAYYDIIWLGLNILVHTKAVMTLEISRVLLVTGFMLWTIVSRSSLLILLYSLWPLFFSSACCGEEEVCMVNSENEQSNICRILLAAMETIKNK